MVLARLGATMAVAAALGLPHPVLAALVICPALDLAGGVPAHARQRSASGAAPSPSRSASRGIGMAQALGVGFAIQALETLVARRRLGGALYLAWPSDAVRRWTLRAATVGVTASLAAASASPCST